VHGKQDNFCARIGFYDFTRRINSVQERHGQVKDRNFRMVRLTQLYGFAAIGSLAHHLKSFSLQKNSQTLTDHLVIVRKQYLNCHLRNSTADRKLKGAGERRDRSSLPRLEPASIVATWVFLILQLTPSRAQNIH
jgi:hypothetical protein